MIGDVVSTAARIEAETRDTGDEVLVGEPTLDFLSCDRGRFEQRPPLPCKGKAKRVRLYAPSQEEDPI